jgi:hypothetical protein
MWIHLPGGEMRILHPIGASGRMLHRAEKPSAPRGCACESAYSSLPSSSMRCPMVSSCCFSHSICCLRNSVCCSWLSAPA